MFEIRSLTQQQQVGRDRFIERNAAGQIDETTVTVGIQVSNWHC